MSMKHRFRHIQPSNPKSLNGMPNAYGVQSLLTSMRSWISDNPRAAIVSAVATGLFIGLVIKERK